MHTKAVVDVSKVGSFGNCLTRGENDLPKGSLGENDEICITHYVIAQKN